MYVILYNLTALQTFHCLWPIMWAQTNTCNSSCVGALGRSRCIARLFGAEARQGPARARGVTEDVVGEEVGPSSSGTAWLPVWLCKWAAGVRGSGCSYGQGEAARLAGAWERAPGPGSNFELNPPNKGICLWCLWGCGQGDAPCLCQRN